MDLINRYQLFCSPTLLSLLWFGEVVQLSFPIVDLPSFYGIYPGKNSEYEPYSLSKKTKAMQPRTHPRMLAVFVDSLQLVGKRRQLIGVPSWKVVRVLALPN